MATLHTQVVSELAACLERAIRVSTILPSLLAMLVGSMATFDAEVVSELAAGLESAIRVALEIFN